MRRGDFVTAAMPGGLGKPRPVLVIQSDQFPDTATVTVLLVSGSLVDAPLVRLDVEPSAENGLRMRSQIMVDKLMTIKRDRLGEPFGRLDDGTMRAVTRSLTLFLGFA